MKIFRTTLRLLLPGVLCLGLAAQSVLAAELPAFPGAEGFGAISKGGRGGRVIEVTNLSDSGSGSFRAAAEASGARTVVFKVGGTIGVKSSIDIEDPYITIAGQTAPGGGITLRNDGNTSATLKIKTHDVIIRFLRIRPGPGGEADGLALQTGEADNIIIDHCSLTWGVDETVSMYTGDKNNKIENVSFQWSIISDALHCSTHGEGCHSKGLLIQYANNVSVHKNLFANNGGRSPMILSGNIEVSNNVIYNWGGSAVKIENRHGDVYLNYVANYLQPGRNSDMSENGIQVKTKGINLYLKDNIATHVRPDNSYPEDAIINYREEATLKTSRFNFPKIALTSASNAYENVLANSGATIPSRDRVDSDIVAGVRNDSGRLIDDPEDVGGYPFLARGDAYADSDSDGMSDEWEDKNGFDKNVQDGRGDKNNNGYTNLEEFLHHLVDTKTGTPKPSVKPTSRPSLLPTPAPTTAPTLKPTPPPKPVPTVAPTSKPTSTPKPKSNPSAPPTAVPTPNSLVVSLVKRVRHDDDDAEEYVRNGRVDLDSSDLELGEESSSQLVGLRFKNLNIPAGAEILSAKIEFVTDEKSLNDAVFEVQAQNSVSPERFSNVAFNISDRSMLNRTVTWAPNDWTEVGKHGKLTRTPDLSKLVQTLVDRKKWSDDAKIVFVITGSGKRVAISHDKSSSEAAKLVIEYRKPVLQVDEQASTDELPLLDDSLMSYGRNQDGKGNGSLARDSKVVRLTSNTWKALEISYIVTENTVLEFDFSSENGAEIQAIGIDDDLNASSKTNFQLSGTQKWGVQDFRVRSSSDRQNFSIPLGEFYLGPIRYLTFINDDDVSNSDADAEFSAIILRERN